MPVRRASFGRTLQWVAAVFVFLAVLWAAADRLCLVLRSRAIERISDLTGLRVQAGSLGLRPDGSFVLKDLVVSEPNRPLGEGEILRAGSIRAAFLARSIFSLRPRLRSAAVEDFDLSVRYYADSGRWNLSAVGFGAEREGGIGAAVDFRKGRLFYSRLAGGKQEYLEQLPVEGRLVPGPDRSHSFSLSSGNASVLKGVWKEGRLEAEGRVLLPAGPPGEAFLAVGKLSIVLEYDGGASYKMRLDAQDTFFRHDARPDPLALVQDTPLGQVRALSALRKFVDLYQAAGRVDISLEAAGKLAEIGETVVSGRVKCERISICKRSFPYRIDRINGPIDFTENALVMTNLHGYHGEAEFIINGWMRDFGPEKRYEVVITSNGLRLDDDLYRALSPKRQRLWSDLSPTGDSLAAIDCRIKKRPRTAKSVTLAVDLLEAEAACRYVPVVLRNLTGTVMFDAGRVKFSDVVSRIDGQEISISGGIMDSDTERPVYELDVHADRLPLGPEDSSPAKGLLDVLPSHVRLQLERLRPTGEVNLDMTIRGAAGEGKPSLKMKVECLGNSALPEMFPYPIRAVTGSLYLDREALVFDGLKACGAAENICSPKVELGGRFERVEGLFEGDLRITARGLALDKRLGEALPGSLAAAFSRLEPGGGLDLQQGRLSLTAAPQGGRQVGWEGVAQLKECSLGSSNVIAGLGGIVESRGFFRGGEGLCEGSIVFSKAALNLLEKSLTEVGAEFNFDRSRGSWVADDFCARLYGGKLAGRIEIRPGSDSNVEYFVDVGFEGVDLRRFMTAGSTRPADRYSSGRMAGSVSASGWLGRRLPVIGQCRLSITDMRLGKLSPIGKLLSVLKLTEPKDFAFDRMIVDAYINHGRLFVQKIDISGESLAFEGSGWVELGERTVDITLTARGPRLADVEPNLLQSLTEGLGQAIIRMEVKGSVEDPVITTTRFPVIKDGLDVLGTR
jgi:hypothetical protein